MPGLFQGLETNKYHSSLFMMSYVEKAAGQCRIVLCLAWGMTKDFLEETIPELILAKEEKVAKPRTGH